MLRWLLLTALLITLASTISQAAKPARQTTSQDEQGGSQEQVELRKIVTDDYVVHTDLPEEQLGPVLQRLGAMVREYRNRTASLSGQTDDRRLPFYLYSSIDDYTRAGGALGSAGLFDGEKLLAYVGAKADARSWHVIQHEAFHQYLLAKLGYDVPIWLNEGLAEYFGEGIFTGDGFVTGVIPEFRAQRVRESIQRNRFVPLQELLSTSHEKWNAALQYENYDHVWSLVHFLAHGDGGRYQDALMRYIQASVKGNDAVATFQKSIGDLPDVERAWQRYWQDLPDAEVRRGWGMAAVQMINSYVARAAAAGQKISSLDELVSLADTDKLWQPRDNELPIDMLSECLKLAPLLGNWQIDQSPKARANVTLKLKGGEQVQARYTLNNGRVRGTEAWYVPEPVKKQRGDSRKVKTTVP